VSRHANKGRLICKSCGGVHPTNRENLQRKKTFGDFMCKRCEKRKHRTRPSW